MPKTSQYPAMTGLTGSERLVGVQGTSTETVTLEQLSEYFLVNSDGVSPADLEAAIADKANAPDLAADDGAAMIGYKPSATGAVKRPVKDKLSDVLSVKDFGAKGDGSSNDTTPVIYFQAASALKVLGPGNYVVGSVGAPTVPHVLIAANAQRNGTDLPFLTIGKEGFGTLPKNYLFIQHDTSDRTDAKTVQIQRIVNSDVGAANPHALRVITVKNHSNASTDWAISGELVSYSNTASTGETAISGVATKYGTAAVFGGHLQANDYNLSALATDVTPLIGAEINTPAVGLDHPTANGGFGNRRCLDIIARTNESVANWNAGPGNFGAGEIGAGIDVRTDDATQGYFRYGVIVREVAGNPKKIGTAFYSNASGAYGLRLVGASTTAAVSVEGNANLGLILSGTFTGPAIRVNSGQYIGMENTNTIKMAWGVTTNVWGFYSGANERVGFVTTASPGIRVAGTQVVGQRDTGWSAMTGTGSKATIAAAAAGTASAAYTQSELQGALNRIAALEARLKAYDAALIAHGLIGP